MVRAAWGVYYNPVYTVDWRNEQTNFRQTAISISNPSYPDPYGGKSPSAFASTAPQNIGTIALARFINPSGLTPLGGNLYAESAASGQPQTGTPGQDGMGTLMQGFVETSNVNVVQELVTMIQTQRAYEMNSKAIQTSDQMLQKLGQL